MRAAVEPLRQRLASFPAVRASTSCANASSLQASSSSDFDFSSPLSIQPCAFRWLSDRLPVRKGAISPVARELRVVPIVNAAAMSILEIEARVASAGFRLPIGTSLVAIARPPHHEDTKNTKSRRTIIQRELWL